MQQLTILNGFNFIGGLLMFIGESESGKTYNVALTFEDFEAYLGVEELQHAYENDQTEGIDFEDHAQCILEAWQRGGTSYEVQVIAQKLKEWKFETHCGGRAHSFQAEFVGNPLAFQLENNYKSYSPVWG